MTPELYQRLKPLFEAALDVPKEKRAAYVAEACRGDAELQKHLEMLLARNDQETDTLDAPFISFKDFARKQTFPDGTILLSRFRIVRFIDSGGMGEVYEAEDSFLRGVHVALKTILPHVAANPDLRKRFEREVLLAREVAHSNLCPIYDIFHCEDPPPGHLFLTMKLLPGQTLSARLLETPTITNEEGLAILRQTSLGLAAIHAAGIIHRDIKPNNILVDGSGTHLRLWITDFGLARAYETESTVSSIGTVAGTPGYIAPELYLGHPPSKASDLFALGVVLHEVFTGQKPTPVPDTHSCAVSPRLPATKTPPLCVRLITEFLQDDPQRRCAAFADTLEVVDPKIDRTIYTGRSGQFWTRRRFVGTAAASVCAATAGAWWKWDDFDDLLYPLPQKRFVALLNWPKPSDIRLMPMLTGVVSAIKSELARAEAFDRNFLVVSPDDLLTGAEQTAYLREVCDSSGANLLLAASGLPKSDGLRVLLQLMDPFSNQVLRRKTLEASINGITSLPNKAVEAAAALLNLRRYLRDDAKADPGTQSAAAFTAFQSAEALMHQQNDTGVEEAIEKYKEAVVLDPNYALAHANLAEAYVNVFSSKRDPGALDLARGNSERALALDPNLVQGLVARALVQEESGDEQKALVSFGRALAIDPSNPETLLLQAQIYTRLNRWPDAEKAYEKIQQMRPNYWATYNEKGYVLDRQGKYHEALQAFRTATVCAPRKSFVFANLGSEYLNVGEYDKAIDSSSKSMTIKPNDLAALTISTALRCKGKTAEAIPFALKATELNPSDDSNWLELGDCYYSVGNRPDDAKSAYLRASKEAQEFLRTDATNGPIWMRLALYQAKAANSKNALSLIQKAETLGASDMDSQLSKVRILELLGKRDAALAALATCYRRGASMVQIAPFPELQSLQKDPRYRQIDRLHASNTPEIGDLQVVTNHRENRS